MHAMIVACYHPLISWADDNELPLTKSQLLVSPQSQIASIGPSVMLHELATALPHQS